MAKANLYFSEDFDGAGYPTFDPWPMDFPVGNPTFPLPVVDGRGNGLANRFQRLLWRARSRNSANTGNYKVDGRFIWQNAGGAGREAGIIVRFKDWNNLVVARLRSNITDSPTLKLYKRVGGVETQLGSTFTGNPFSASNMNAGLVYRVRVEDKTDGSGETSVKVYSGPQGDSGNGTAVVTWQGDLSELRGTYTVGVELGKDCGLEDVKADYLKVWDFADEPNLSGTSPAAGTGWVVQLDDTQYPIDDRTGGLEGLDPPVEFSGCGHAFGFSGGAEAKFRVLGDYRTALLRVGMRVKAWEDGDLRFEGVITQQRQSANVEESQEFVAKAGIYAAADILVESDQCEPQILWNQDPENKETYDPDFANKKSGDIIKFLLDRYKQQLQARGAAPADGTSPYVTEELQAFDAVIPGLATGGNLLGAIQTLLALTPYQIFWDPQTRIWHFRDVSDLQQQDVALNSEWVQITADTDTQNSCFTAVVFQGTRPEKDDDIEITMADRAWTQAQQDASDGSRKNKTYLVIKGKDVVGFGLGTFGDPGLVYADVLAKVGLQEDDWRGAICSISSDSYPRFVTHNTSTRIWMSSPAWGGGGPLASPPTPHSDVILNLLDPEAQKQLAASGVGQVYFLPPVLIDGTTSCNYAPFASKLRNEGFCGTATVSGTGKDGARFSEAYYFKVQQPTKTAQAAGFCRPMAELAKPVLKPMALINFFDDRNEGINLSGVGGMSGGEGGGLPATQCAPGQNKFAGIDVSIKIPKNKTCAPRLRVPETGWRGSAFSQNAANWDGAGEPAGTDAGVMRELPIPLSEFTSSEMNDGLKKAGDIILKLTGQLPRRVQLEIATPWRTWSDGTAQRTSATSTWAGLTKRVTLSSTARATGFETAESLPVYAVWWDVPGNKTILQCGTASGWIGGDYGAIAKNLTAKDAALIAAKQIKALEDFRNQTLDKDPTRVMGGQAGPQDGCNTVVVDKSTKKVTNLTNKLEIEQEGMNHLSLGRILGDTIGSAAEPNHPGSPIPLAGLGSDAAKQITADSGPAGASLANPRILFQGPVDAPNGNRSRFGGLIGQDDPDAGRPPNDNILVFGNYAFRGTPNASGTTGGRTGLQLSPLDSHGAPTEAWVDFRTSLDFPEGRAPLSALNTLSIQHQLKLRDDALAAQIGAVQDALGKVQAPGDVSDDYPDGAPANLASIARSPSLMSGHFKMVAETWNDPGGPVWYGPFKEGGVDPGLYWRAEPLESRLVLVEKVGGGPNGSAWADWTGGPGGTAFVCEYADIVHKNFSGAQLDWDRRYEPADSMSVSNPFGFDAEESLRLGAVTPGQPCGAGVVFDVPDGVRAFHFTYQLSEDPDGVAVSAGETYGFRIDWATRSSPWGGVTTGATQTALAGSGSNDSTGPYKQPGGAVPPGLRTPSDIATSGVYVPGAGTASTNASVGVLGVGVDLAIVEGGFLLRVKQRVEVEEESVVADPWAAEVVGAFDDFSFEMDKELAEAVAVYEDFALEVNPPVFADEGVAVLEEFSIEFD